MKKKTIGSHVIDAISTIATENNISKSLLFSAIENAFVMGAQKKYGTNVNMIARCDRITGDVKLFRILNVVSEISDRAKEIDLTRAKKINKNVAVGDDIEEEIPSGDFDRVIVKKMSDVINSCVINAKKEQEYEIYHKRIGQIVHGSVKSISPREIIVWIGQTEAKMDIRDTLPNERFNLGDKVIACIQNVNQDMNNPQVCLSRKSNQFLECLFKNEVPECEDGLINIVSIAREPGFRAKVAVASGDSRTDPVGACIGPKGVRVKSIMEELRGEKIDIIEYSQDMELFVQRAIIPARPSGVFVNHNLKSVDVVVDEENLSLAIGRKGQNVRLLSRLTGYKIDVMLESERQDRSAKKFAEIAERISTQLNLDEIVGQVLVASGFGKTEDIANAEIDTLAAIEGFDSDVANVIKNRAIEYINHINESQDSQINELGMSPEVFELPILTKTMLVTLGQNDIKTVTDIADLASDELVEILGGEEVISEKDAGDVVMIARKFVYGI
ncbi:transcription termination factor NusA [Candidatus Deianiraea vastatrix]|uniref:Transcription termination/antitermination protein NusA n=1 Tax=Candidatus Deianiraea vastatrix TaxID=2163644 RepID=A0A5B8XD54_9RICK|nr:transcription termination factor NusA [Candidatus Deianiraea vastatrix]QED22956.1 Transcription termination/antitermination protein NusA [Candidatus Deianiraea vastatrix]